jgi:hypothetical protein
MNEETYQLSLALGSLVSTSLEAVQKKVNDLVHAALPLRLRRSP